MTDRIPDYELIAAEHGLYFPSSLGSKVLASELAVTYDEELAVAQADFDRILAIPLADRSNEDNQRFVDVSHILMGDL
ncbi:hypothetical protein EKI60_02070 [Candidatus Saccharibacteria bacterium]|nr:MAG: hypothetical protein EKI60_02070 [Candidatus Saccharibacteria bacterium]